jgi:RNA polymerase sigma-70 factor (ECF subfamily)
LGICKNEDCAEELTQETFYKALKSISTFRNDCKLSTWLCQIAKNCFLTYAVKNKRDMGLVEALFEHTHNGENSAEEKILARETYKNIQDSLQRIEEPYKEVFWLRAFKELSFAQIAHKYGKTESWARVTYHRAKMKIKEELK